MYIKVSGILEGAKVGVFVGTPVNRDRSIQRIILRDAYDVALYSARFYSQ